MRIPYEWLESFFDTSLPEPGKLAELIEVHAFEVESVEGEGKDAVLDIAVTPNRSADALSVRGIAKEVSAILSAPLKDDPLKTRPELIPASSALSVSLGEAAGFCRRYTGAVITGVSIKPSPEWLVKRLEALGQRSINNIVDATNYMMFLTGQPLHAYDKKALGGGAVHVVVGPAAGGELFDSLDGNEYELSASDVVIRNGEAGVVLGVAGVKGGRAAQVSETTVDIVLESANFDPVFVRKTSKRLKLRTDASARFEAGLPAELAGYGLAEAVRLILELAGGTLEGYVDEDTAKEQRRTVSVSLGKINAVLGASYATEDVSTAFDRLGFSHTKEGENFSVTPPFERLDISIAEDLVEEVGRILGYSNLPSKAPEVSPNVFINKRFFYSERVRDALLGEGYSELYTSSFRSAGETELANAVASDKNFLRPELAENLREALIRNTNHAPLLGLDRLRVFELGSVFPKGEERYMLAVGVGLGKAKETAAEFARLSELLSKALGVPVVLEPKDGVAEIALDELLEHLPEPEAYEPVPILADVSYRPFSPYPSALRDIALWVPAGVSDSSVVERIRAVAGDLLVRADLFDTFSKDGRASYAFHLVFQAPDRTLTDAELTAAMERVSDALKEQGFEIR